uniref:Alpha-(1,6)-fucosyltransferase N- and catalytic domain-containing protein n=1 Tax=Meloidogyne enterolobii TaxID=390850 RepID=A0A6V7TI87_MELEN|nr:unnamed protein product [Meloidogyne enterolobii]
MWILKLTYSKLEGTERGIFRLPNTVYPLIVQLSLLDRTLLINRPPRRRLKNKPTGRTNRRNTVRPFLPLSKYKSTEQQDKVLLLRIRYEVERELILPHSPEAVPLEFKEILTKHHTNPPAWFMGQIIKFVLRENQTTSAKLDKVEATFNLGKG